MSATRPDSTIKYYKVPDVDITGRQVYAWKSEAEREHVFAKWQVATETNCTVIRNSWSTFKSSLPITTLEGCNMMSFVNPSYGNKIYYCKITIDCDYVNNNVTKVNYLIDWYTTDFKHYVAQESAMAREGLTVEEYNRIADDGNLYQACRQLPSLDEKMRSPEVLNCSQDTENPYKVLDGGGGTGQGVTVTKDNSGNIIPDFGTNDGINLTRIPTLDSDSRLTIGNQADLMVLMISVPALNRIDESRVDAWYDRQDKMKETDPSYTIQHPTYAYQHQVANRFRQLIMDNRMYDAYSSASCNNPYLHLCPRKYIYDDTTYGAMTLREINDTYTPGSSEWIAATQKHNLDMQLYDDDGMMFTPIDSSGHVETYLAGANADYRYGTMFTGLTYPTWMSDVGYSNTFGEQMGSHYKLAHATIIGLQNNIFPILNFLTNNDLTSCVLGVYEMPSAMLAQMLDYRFMKIPYPYAGLTNAQVAESPKLFMSPFTYFTIESSDSDSRVEYKYENCRSFSGIDYHNNVLINRNVSVSPSGIVNGAGVVGYESQWLTNEVNPQTGSPGSATASGGDYKNMSYADNFPMIPFTTDSYLEFLSKTARQIASTDTQRNRVERNINVETANIAKNMAYIDAGVNVASTVASSGLSLGSIENNRVGNIAKAKDSATANRINASAAISAGETGVGAASRTAGIVSSVVNPAIQAQNTEFLTNWQEYEMNAAAGALGDEGRLKSFGNMYMSNAKAGYVAPSYHPSTQGGVLNRLQCMQKYGLYLIKHTRSTTYTNLFKKWFKNFGYSTGQIKVPAILTFVEDDSSTKAPHFERKQFRKNNNGTISTYYRDVFYTQTTDLILSGEVAEQSLVYTKSLFNSGCLFLRPTDSELA